jgi:uncharacterized protein (TIGR02246 family)
MARTPDELDAEWAEAFNAGDGEKLLGLYEAGAAFVLPGGDVVEGVDNIASAVGGFFALKPRIDLQTRRVIRTGEIALVYSSWTVTGTAPDGSTVELQGEPVVVLREQADGTWKFVLDDPGWSDGTAELLSALR